MKQESPQLLYLHRLQYESQQSELTDYNDDPHIYSNIWQYIFSVVGVTVGFGAFWRFPYLIFKNGGGVFLIPYMIGMILIGMPLLYLQTACGQMHRLSVPYIFKRIHPSLMILGIATLTGSLHLSSIYNILLVYCYRFMITAFNPTLPFADEDISDNQYFHDVILQDSKSINNFQAINPTLFVIYILSILACHFVIKNGAKTTGKIVIFTASAPFVLFIVLILRGIFLEGAYEGITYLFKPDWSKLWTPTIWIDATTQVFYQTSVGLGTIINLASMKARRDDIWKSVLMVPISLLLCGILSALTIFIYLSHFCTMSGLTIDSPDLHLAGLELSFNVIPKALCLLPLSNLWVFLFFFAMILLGIDSQFGMIEALYCYLRDAFKQGPVLLFNLNISFDNAKYLLLVLISVGSFTLTSHAGIHYLQFYDYFISNIPFTLWAAVQLYFFVYVFKFEELSRAVEHYTKAKVPGIISYCLQSYWLPALLICNLCLAFFNQILTFQKYTFGFYLLGWTITLYPVILCYFYIKRQWGGWQQLKLTFYQLQNRPSYL